MNKEQNNQSVTRKGFEKIFGNDPMIIVESSNEKIITTHSIYHQVIEEQLRKGKDVKAPNGDWYERERNYDPDTLRPKSGYHILKYPQGKSPFVRLGKQEEFFKKIPEIFQIPKWRECSS